jgi:hypothetical protein
MAHGDDDEHADEPSAKAALMDETSRDSGYSDGVTTSSSMSIECSALVPSSAISFAAPLPPAQYTPRASVVNISTTRTSGRVGNFSTRTTKRGRADSTTDENRCRQTTTVTQRYNMLSNDAIQQLKDRPIALATRKLSVRDLNTCRVSTGGSNDSSPPCLRMKRCGARMCVRAHMFPVATPHQPLTQTISM